MTSIACYTSFSFSYLSRAIMLVRTLKEAHPDWTIWAMLVDEPPPGLDAKAALADFDSYVYARDLGFERYRSWIFKHDIVEACTAVKGKMLGHLLSLGYDKVVYFDPDIAVFHPLDSVVDRLGECSILLTPHQVDANVAEAAVRDNEITSMQYGIYNLGFVAVNNDDTGTAFASWWARQLYFACYDEVESGIFTDQKWCDLVPALFDNVYIVRDPGCNVASWNLSKRRAAITSDGAVLINGSPLKFYHYTKINAAGDIMTERYAGDNVEIMEVWNWYKRAIKRVTVQGIPSGYWHYGQFDSGEKIPKAVRILYRRRPDLMAAFPDPFATAGNSFRAWLQTEMPALLADSSVKGFEAI